MLGMLHLVPKAPGSKSSTELIRYSNDRAAMARTTRLTTDALKRLGAPTLADVLAEHAGIDSVLRKKLGILLAGTEGAEKLSNEIENRIRTIGRSRSFVDWDKRKGLIQELTYLRTTISGTLAKQDPTLAAERMWELIGIADSVLERIVMLMAPKMCSVRR
jgi:hypothetical protein